MKIHKAINKAQLAVLYYRELTGEDLSSETASNRFNSTKRYDMDALESVMKAIGKEQSGYFKEYINELKAKAVKSR